jgi:hypothetical protein
MIYKTSNFMTIMNVRPIFTQCKMMLNIISALLFKIYKPTALNRLSARKKFFNRVSIDRKTWNTLESQDKAAWDTLSTAAKAKILNGTLKGGEERALTCKPVSLTYSKPTAKTPIANTRTANVNETHNGQEEEEVHKAPPDEPSPNLGSFSHNISDTKLLINFAKSKLLPSDIRSILSQLTTKAKATQASRLQGQYDVGFHHVSDSEHIAQHNVSVFL